MKTKPRNANIDRSPFTGMSIDEKAELQAMVSLKNPRNVGRFIRDTEAVIGEFNSSRRLHAHDKQIVNGALEELAETTGVILAYAKFCLYPKNEKLSREQHAVRDAVFATTAIQSMAYGPMKEKMEKTHERYLIPAGKGNEESLSMGRHDLLTFNFGSGWDDEVQFVRAFSLLGALHHSAAGALQARMKRGGTRDFDEIEYGRRFSQVYEKYCGQLSSGRKSAFGKYLAFCSKVAGETFADVNPRLKKALGKRYGELAMAALRRTKGPRLMMLAEKKERSNMPPAAIAARTNWRIH